MPRQSRIDAPGALHHIIARGIGHRHIFNDNKDLDGLKASTRKGSVKFVNTGWAFSISCYEAELQHCCYRTEILLARNINCISQKISLILFLFHFARVLCSLLS